MDRIIPCDEAQRMSVSGRAESRLGASEAPSDAFGTVNRSIMLMYERIYQLKSRVATLNDYIGGASPEGERTNSKHPEPSSALEALDISQAIAHDALTALEVEVNRLHALLGR